MQVPNVPYKASATSKETTIRTWGVACRARNGLDYLGNLPIVNDTMTGPEIFVNLREVVRGCNLAGESSVWHAWQPSCRVPTVYKARAVMVRDTAVTEC